MITLALVVVPFVALFSVIAWDPSNIRRQAAVTLPVRQEHVILVAFEVTNEGSREAAERALHQRLVPLLFSRDPSSPIESWWVAEDDRADGSDCDSAVFVKPGSQRQARAVLLAQGLAQ